MKNSMGNESQKFTREHRKRQSRHLGCLRRHGRTLGCALFGPANDFLLHAPDDAPHIQHHEPAQPAADADGQGAIALPALLIQARKT